MSMMNKNKRMWANLQMDNAKDTARGGVGNWYPVEVPGWMGADDWAEYIKGKTGYPVYNFADEIQDALKKRQGWSGWWA